MKMQHRWIVGIIAACCAAMVGCGPQYEVASAPDMDRALALRGALGGGASASSAGGAAGGGAEPTGWATLKGRVVYDGTPPAQGTTPVTAEVGVCGSSTPDESLVVGSDGGIKSVLLFVNTKLPTEEPWVHPTMMPGGDPVEFDQKKCVFLSHLLAARVGQTVKIMNSDPTGHNTNLQPRANPPMNKIVGAGSSLDWIPEVEEKTPFPVSCSIHPHMKAYMIVRNNGYFAVTDENGNFEIPNLPAGVELELRVWQQKSGWVDGVEVDGNTIKKGKVEVTFEPGAEKQWELALGESVFN